MAVFFISWTFSTVAFAYTTHLCETADASKAVCLLFDMADNDFVSGSFLGVDGQQTTGVLQSGDRIRPRPIDPNHPLLEIAFGNETFELSLDAATATLTGPESTEPMVCGSDFAQKCWQDDE
jgi:hypothetical protein